MKPATAMQPGYDGSPYITERVRDLEGQGKREAIRQRRQSVIGALVARHLLDSHHEDAAARLQRDAEAAEIRVQSSLANGAGSGSSGPRMLSDKQMAAMLRHADARETVRKALGVAGSRGETLIRLVVIENTPLETTAKIMGIPAREITTALRFSLDVLARFYGLA